MGAKKRAKQVNRLDELPEDLRNFIDGIMIKETEAQVPNRRPRKKKEVVVREDPRKKLVNSRSPLTDQEIVEVWSRMKVGYPESILSRPNIMEIVRRTFPRCDADLVLRNIFRILEQDHGAVKISPRDLLMAYSMSTTGTVDEKLHHTFKLFDADGNGVIDILEMETVFVSLVAIANSSESDQMKRNKKRREDEAREAKIQHEKQTALMMAERERELENRKYQVKALNFKVKLQRNKKSLSSTKNKRVETAKGRKRRDFPEDTKEKLENTLQISKELSDPLRDYRKYDTRKRAQELFSSFNSDNTGFITESQFIEGCKSDETFVKIFSEPNTDFILGFSDD